MTSPVTLLKAWNLHAKKKFGQNFLKDPSTTEMIVDRSGLSKDDAVLEIGAGFGALTIPAARAAQKVYAVEKDRELIQILSAELLAQHIDNVTILEEDILKLDLLALADQEGCKLWVMGNLPYNISSQIIVKLIRFRHAVRRAVVMLQKELAQRISANPGGKDYGRLTAMTAYCADVHPIAQISASQFYPKPKVDSTVLTIDFLEPRYPAVDERHLFKVIKAAFGQRRKTLRNALAGSELHLDSAALGILNQAGIDPGRRAETLAIEEFVRLSNLMVAWGIFFPGEEASPL